jgi:hypothetical protein
MSIIRRGACMAYRFTAIAGGARCLAWAAQSATPVPRVLGDKPATRLGLRNFTMIV